MTTNTSKHARVVIRPRTPFFVNAEKTVLHPEDDLLDVTGETIVSLYLTEVGGRNFVMLGEGQGRFELTPQNVEALQTRSWVASPGVRGKSSRIVIPSREMRRFFAHFGIEVEFEAAA
jgi:hypothetical protein